MNPITIKKIVISISLWVLCVIGSSFFDAGTISWDVFIRLHTEHLVFPLLAFILLIAFPVIAMVSDLILLRKIDSAANETALSASNVEHNLGFTTKLIDGDLEYSFSPEDKLGESLVQLRDRLKSNAEEEARRKQEDVHRNWATEGQAKFAEILRINNNKDLETLTYAVVNNIIKYLGANQGAIFLYEREREVFEMSACYAYGQKKMREKVIKSGIGLIGRIGIEKETIYLTDIPQDYIKITSGLGEERPSCLVILPIIANEILFGAMEIASFKNIEQYQIDFLEKISEVVGSTIAGVRINLQTAALLEDSQEQSSKLVQQEEAMMKNMESLKEIQKEATLQAEEFVSFSNSVNHTMIRADYDVEGIMLYANTKFVNKMGYEFNSEVEGQSIFSFINSKDREWFNKIWETLSLGGTHYEGFMKHMTKNGEDLWTLSTYTCVRDESGNVRKILFLAIDTTDSKKKSIEYEGIIKALDRSNLKMEMDLSGRISNPNTNLISALGYSVDALESMEVRNTIKVSDLAKFDHTWASALAHNAAEETLGFTTATGSDKWFFGSFTVVRDMYGDVGKIIFVGSDMTEQVLIESKVAEQNKKLTEQELLLQNNKILLEKELELAKAEMKQQFKEVERAKVLNEKTLEGAIDAILTFNNDGNVLFFNHAAEDLWGFKKIDVIDKPVKQLFSDLTVTTDAFVNSMVTPKKEKIVGVRQQVGICTKLGDSKQVLILISEAQFEGDHTFTAFVQNIEVELF